MARLIRRILHPVVRLAFRPTLEGVEHLPRRGPFLLVANHSAGIGLAELASFAALYVTQVGPERPLAGFAHPIGFRIPPMAALLRALGAVPSTYEAAREALTEGVPLLVFPGGDHETLRPVWQASRVDFAGRRGFLRVAREANVPIIPMGIRGSHCTAPVLLRSKLLAWGLVLPRSLGLKRYGVTLLGLIGLAPLLALPVPWAGRVALAWLWLASPLVFLPFVPWTIRFRIGPPLPPEALFERGDPEATRALATVQAAVQALVDRS